MSCGTGDCSTCEVSENRRRLLAIAASPAKKNPLDTEVATNYNHQDFWGFVRLTNLPIQTARRRKRKKETRKTEKNSAVTF